MKGANVNILQGQRLSELDCILGMYTKKFFIVSKVSLKAKGLSQLRAHLCCFLCFLEDKLIILRI